jgi:steroid 5-alpha reductase family enzyme
MTLGAIIIATVTLWAALAAVMAVGWAIQQRTRNSGYVDAVWTFGLGIIGVVAALTPVGGMHGPTTRQLVIGGIITAWSVRLGSHILQRTLGRADDPRYADLIRQWGSHAPRQMFILLQKQALVTLPLALTVMVAANNPAPFGNALDMLGIAVLLLGIAGEFTADRQLRACRAALNRKPGTICEEGLWGWSRHPNYFFEWFFWLGFPLLAIDPSGNYPTGWLALMAPACMYWLLVYISGIPPLEKHMLERYGDAYRDYQKRTSAFFPLPPRAKA